MTTYRRSGFKWTINELLSLQREYELLEWTVQQIAKKHERSVEAILFCLESEGFISSWNTARGYNQIDYQNAIEGGDSLESNVEEEEQDEEEDEEEDEESSICEDPNDIQVLTERVLTLENIIFDVKDMMQQLMSEMKKNVSGNNPVYEDC
jgi:hypothetical protein